MLKKIFKTFGFYFGLLLLTIILFDVAAFFLVPDKLVKQFTHYRCDDCVKVTGVKGNGRYPYDYFENHDERGFDLAPNRRNMLHTVDGKAYQIWSNSLGCYDKEQSPTSPYVYVAGDSQTWGYTPYRLKFATRLEEKTSVPVLKCGVTHTGQKHQLSKLKAIASKLKTTPSMVFVGFYPNDIQNDLAYPHTGVISGWLKDYAGLLDDGSGTFSRDPRDFKKLKAQYAPRLPSRESQLAKHDYIKLKPIGPHYRYMLSYNMYKAAKRAWKRKKQGKRVKFSVYTAPFLEAEGRLNYQGNPNTLEHKQALQAFKSYVNSINSGLAIILIPPKTNWDDKNYFTEIKEFLNQNQIAFIDMASAFASQKEMSLKDIYWKHDGHLRDGGNQLVAQEMENWLRKNKPALLTK
ncbi:exported hypothetical protein [Candidatus Terasakiella magnetica]|uniref:Uncharacterized protein n=1 Tax=Candidatus Terasakiella magnetica TaxID=1867952 RepID=A0A1C3RG97_9PROT|nr:hypothetical protein [Candidatus Terasakiella magnetica]SCA56285.1 exported hypothetical protein [Candidatus Terasakiella magnetica]